MRVPTLLALAFLSSLETTEKPPGSRAPVARVAINDNRTPAGTLREGVLTVRLEVREGDWRPDAESAPGVIVHAFAERGKRASVPGPMLRVTEGTDIHAFVTNSLARGTLVVHGLSTRGGSAASAGDTLQIAAVS